MCIYQYIHHVQHAHLSQETLAQIKKILVFVQSSLCLTVSPIVTTVL
jgi:hypothetical protein